MNFADFKRQIRTNLKAEPDVASCRWFRTQLALFVKSGDVKFVDDFCGAQVAGSTAGTLGQVTNGPLIDELFSQFTWHRMHRNSYWVRGFGDVHAPSGRLIESLGRMISFGEIIPVLDPGVLTHLRAAKCFVMQDLAGADRMLRQAPFPEHPYMSSFMLGSRTFRDVYSELDVRQISSEQDGIISWSNLQDLDHRFTDSDRIFVFSCDEAYFRNFAARAVETALNEVSSATVVIGVVSSAGEEIQRVDVDDLVAQNSALKALRSRVLIVHGRTEQELRPMTALGRFLLAQRVHAASGKSCFIFDIDIEFQREMTHDVLRIFEGDSLGVSFNVYGRAAYPWAKVTAAAVHVPSGDRGAFFYKVYISYARLVLDVGRNWWIDQNALFAAYSMYRTYYPTSQIANTHRLLATGISGMSDPGVRKFKSDANRKMRGR